MIINSYVPWQVICLKWTYSARLHLYIFILGL